MKIIYFIIFLLFIQSYAFASYFMIEVDKNCKLESYNKLVDFIKSAA